MREERFKHAIRMRLLVLVLTLALIWYPLNPASSPVRRVKRYEEPPEEKRHGAKSPLEVSNELRTGDDAMKSSFNQFSPAVEDIDDIEWPEVIDIR